jgi:hypothetical protein
VLGKVFFMLMGIIEQKRCQSNVNFGFNHPMGARRVSNPRPPLPQSGALTPELQAP